MTVYDIAAKLPEREALRDRCRALAMLSAIFEPGDLEYRNYQYYRDWTPGVDMAAMDNGGGDQFWIVFDPAGVYIQGFDHESAMSPYADNEITPWPGVVDSVPEVFGKYLEEPAFQVDGVPAATACLWRENGDGQWRTGTVEFPESGVENSAVDGADYLFRLLVSSAEACKDWAEDYFDSPVDLDGVRELLALRPLTSELVSRLNPEIDPAELDKDIEAVGYPRRPEG